MKTAYRTTILASSVAALSACGMIHPEAFDEQGVNPAYAQQAPDRGNAFQRSLHQGYADFGRWEFQQADFRDAKYFNDRAKLTAAGQNVAPTDPATRDIDPGYMPELTAARSRLVQAITSNDAMNRVPAAAGAAQVYFDCWAEQAEEGHQPEHIAYCKNGFETSMGQLVQLTPAPAPAPQPTAQAPTARPYLVFFDWDKSSLTESTMPTINQIASTVKNGNPATIRIGGHADKSGSNTYNDGLSKRRADAVLDALQRQGVPRGKAQIEFFGESRPLVDTADGVREPQNRRVEVQVR